MNNQLSPEVKFSPFECRKRSYFHLGPLEFGKWTKEENSLLLKKRMEFGNDYKKIAVFFPGRGIHEIKNYIKFNGSLITGKGIMHPKWKKLKSTAKLAPNESLSIKVELEGGSRNINLFFSKKDIDNHFTFEHATEENESDINSLTGIGWLLNKK